MDIPILFEDAYIIVVDKPAGVVVNRSDTSGEETVQDWAEKRLTAHSTRLTANGGLAFSSRSGIVHRLDKETSGCLIIAKTPEAFVELQRQFVAREVQKEYLALVHGKVEPKEGTINVPLARSRYDRQKFAVMAGGRMAETKYQVESLLSFSPAHSRPEGAALRRQHARERQTPTADSYTLLNLFPKTGRTHQIRVHLKYFGYPIVADETYAGADRAREDRTWCPRMFLHAAKISFTHPTNKRRITVESPLPEDLQKVLS